MSEYTITVDDNTQAGLESRATLTNKSVDEVIQEILVEQGVLFLNKMKQRKINFIMEKVREDPDAYMDTVQSAFDAKVVAERSIDGIGKVSPSGAGRMSMQKGRV